MIRQNHHPPGSESLGPSPDLWVWCEQWEPAREAWRKVEERAEGWAPITKWRQRPSTTEWDRSQQFHPHPDDVSRQRVWESEFSVMKIAGANSPRRNGNQAASKTTIRHQSPVDRRDKAPYSPVDRFQLEVVRMSSRGLIASWRLGTQQERSHQNDGDGGRQAKNVRLAKALSIPAFLRAATP